MRIGLKSLFVAVAVFALTSSLWGQKVKSKKEGEAINAINAATTVDDRIKAIENVLNTFKDTEFKSMLLQMAMQLEVQKGDYAQVMFYGDRILADDPKNPLALVTMAGETARRTREFDLDKDEKLNKAEKWAKDGIEFAKTAPKPQANKYDEAIADYKQSIAVAGTPDAATWLRLGQAYEDASKWDDANDAFDKAASAPNASPQVKNIAASKKTEVAKLRGGAK